MKHSPHLTVPITRGATLTLRRGTPLFSTQSDFQRICVEQTTAFGRLYTLDDDPMAAEADEFIIHESLAHLVALSHPAPRRALVLGGGDGASARELLRHPSIEQIAIAELDPAVVATIRDHLPALPAGAFDNPRVRITYGDAAATLQGLHTVGERFDLILFDLVASNHPACAHLHAEAFFRACAATLTHDGMVHVQLGSPFHDGEVVRQIHHRLSAVFPDVRPALIDVPLYGGPWLMARARQNATVEPEPALLANRLLERRITGLRYYNPALHYACGALPNYVRDCLTGTP